MRSHQHEFTAVHAVKTDGPISKIVAANLRGGTLQFAGLEAALKAAGYTISYDTLHFKNSVQASVNDSTGALAACGTDRNKDEALLLAIYGTVRQEHADQECAKAFSSMGITKITEPQRIKAQQDYILRGVLPGSKATPIAS